MHRSTRNSRTRNVPPLSPSALKQIQPLTVAKINLSDGDHNAVLRNAPHREMVLEWTNFADQFERLIFEVYGVGSFPVAEVAPVIAYASVARAAFALCSAAEIAKGSFDPVEFGQ